MFPRCTHQKNRHGDGGEEEEGKKKTPHFKKTLKTKKPQRY